MERNGFMSSLSLGSNAVTRSASPENVSAEKGKGGMAEHGTGEHFARELGRGWKISPSVHIAQGETYVLADLKGPAVIKHIWLTLCGIPGRYAIIRFYWDGCEVPSVECPLGDFFANAFVPEYIPVSSLAVCVNPRNGLNCYWDMPFRKSCRITVENIADNAFTLFYQVDFEQTEVPDTACYFHAHFHRSNPLGYMCEHTLLDGVCGSGHYVGSYMAWGVNNNGWWGEGEFKFYLDGDTDYPTICGTGTEDYFCGAYNFDADGKYERFCTPYSGMTPLATDGLYKSQQRFSLYRWHITDPIRFSSDIRVTAQALGWRSDGRYLPLQDDISSVAFFYLDKPLQSKPELPSRNFLEII